MQVRSIEFKDFRSFRGEHTLSFCDPLTGEPRPITVLAGTNGTGKTTVLEAIEALTSLALQPPDKLTEPTAAPRLIREAWDGGYVHLELRLMEEELTSRRDPKDGVVLHVSAGNLLASPGEPSSVWPDGVSSFRDGTWADWQGTKSNLGSCLSRSVQRMYFGDAPYHGGLAYFPHDRILVVEEAVSIEPPQRARPWVDRVEDTTGWSGSLEKYWVWLNYLDLEQGQQPGTRLRPFSEKVAHLLGRERRIYIREGRVYVTAGKSGARDVRLNELPSGEKQILLIMGELARRVRPGMVVLIDEPETSLHPALQHALVYQFEQYARDEGVQFILGTHSLEIVEALPNSVLFLDHLKAEPPVVGERAAAA
jgi:energy-coupling factor transporter ATP-binding protein EcfA2